MQFDVSNFYLSITNNLFNGWYKVINIAKNYCTITDQEINVIKQPQRAIIYHDGSMLTKKTAQFSL